MASPFGSGRLGPSALALVKRVSDVLGIGEEGQSREAWRSDLQQPLLERSQRRLKNEDLRDQQNLESITAMAVSFLNGDSTPEKISDGWLAYFSANARLIPDRQTQMFWAKVLAGEANRPGSFSRRSLACLVSIDTADLKMLANVRRACIQFDKFVLFVYELNGKIYRDNGMDFPTLLHLDEIGLLNFTEVAEHSAITSEGLRGCVQYFDEQISVELGPNQRLRTGFVTLTRTGEELVRICDAGPIEGFSDYIRRTWQSMGVHVSLLTECA